MCGGITGAEVWGTDGAETEGADASCAGDLGASEEAVFSVCGVVTVRSEGLALAGGFDRFSLAMGLDATSFGAGGIAFAGCASGGVAVGTKLPITAGGVKTSVCLA